MIRSPLIKRQSIATTIGAAARKCSAVAIATAVLLLSAPFVNTTRHEEILPPRMPRDDPAASDCRLLGKVQLVAFFREECELLGEVRLRTWRSILGLAPTRVNDKSQR